MASFGSRFPNDLSSTADPSGVPWDGVTGGLANRFGDASDATYGFVSTNASGTYARSMPFDSVPSDIASVTALSVLVRYGWSATPTNTTWDQAGSTANGIEARIVASDLTTILAANLSGGTLQEVVGLPTATTPTNSPTVPFNYVNTGASQAQWDSARIQVQINRTRSKGGGTEEQRIYEVTITGTYTPTAPASPRETRTFRRVLQAVNRAGSYIVGPSGVLVPDRRILVPVRG